MESKLVFILGGPAARITRFCGSLQDTTLLLCLVTNCFVISDSFRSLARLEVLTDAYQVFWDMTPCQLVN